ncbi:hypothetical protein HPB49_011021 [Dermacentor silvarum]|uniref:Uncharacterized protein n=1 Tax=Dermacentor silvarum TaxID=543639 RepID=A0ACB8C8X1_DERSI|nr:hypothetical protein HPB49_011021 [Dermacentor silvarum]
MLLYERLETFEGDGSAWPVYEEQVHVFFWANETPEAKQRDIFLASCGTCVFSLLLDLLKPAAPHVKTLSELLTTLQSHFSPAPSTLMERFRFNNWSRREGETLGQFVAALPGSTRCSGTTMQIRLLKLPDPSLDDVVKAAQVMDAAAKDTGEIARVTASPSPTHNASRAEKLGTLHEFAEGVGQTAYSSSSLEQAQVPHKPKIRVAVARVREGDVRQQARGPSAARLHVVAENPLIFDTWHTALVSPSVPPWTWGHGVMAGKLFKPTCPDVFVEASGVTLRSYSGQLSQVQGQAQVSIRFGDRKASLPPYLTKGSSPTLLGRN